MIYNPYPQINLSFGNDNKYFKWLFDAICNVEKRYLTYTVEYASTDDESQRNHLERVFAYELYHQWSYILEKEGNLDLLLNAEIDKNIDETSIEIINDEEDSGTHKINVFPDLVLHHSQSDSKNQKLICEIKRNVNLKGPLIFADLYKLTCYMCKKKFHSDYNPFEYGVFILANGSLTEIRNLLKIDTKIKKTSLDYTIGNYMNDEDFKGLTSHIVCIAYDGTTLEYETLDKILKGIDKAEEKEN